MPSPVVDVVVRYKEGNRPGKMDKVQPSSSHNGSQTKD